MSVELQRRQFTVTDFYRMAASGVLTENDRVELIDGEVIEMSPIRSRHAGCVDRLNTLLTAKSKGRYIVRVQGPIRLNETSEPLPDIALLKVRDDFYSNSHPTPEDVLLVIEVADTSIEYDRDTKAPLYAKGGIPEMWIVDLERDLVITNTDPDASGYRSFEMAMRGEEIRSVSIEGLSFSIDDLVGPA